MGASVDGEPVSPEGAQEGKGDLSCSGHLTAASSPQRALGKLRLRTHGVLTADTRDAYERGDSENPDSCLLPYTDRHRAP